MRLIFFLLILAKVSFPQPGQLDPTLGHGGIVTTALNNSENNSVLNASVIYNNEKIVAAGTNNTSEGSDFAVARFNMDGAKFKLYQLVNSP